MSLGALDLILRTALLVIDMFLLSSSAIIVAQGALVRFAVIRNTISRYKKELGLAHTMEAQKRVSILNN